MKPGKALIQWATRATETNLLTRSFKHSSIKVLEIPNDEWPYLNWTGPGEGTGVFGRSNLVQIGIIGNQL